MHTFMGYERPDGSIGIRNHIAVLPSVSCANGVVAAIAREVSRAVPLYHGHGCGRGGTDLELHGRTLVNLARNPNIAGVLIAGLGCEVFRAENLAMGISASGKPLRHFSIQNEGGSQKAAAKGIVMARQMIEEAEGIRRKEYPLSELTLGLECGGSDAFSGVTANPVVGLVADWLAGEGGRVILSETTEMIGTGRILERRAKNRDIAAAVMEKVNEAEKRAQEIMGPLAQFVIAPGNMDGGMSSIREKSLGCIIKGGSTTINQVVRYAEQPSERGLVIMDGPGYDTESMTGLAAAGSQVIVFTTGRGNPIGFPVVPVIKVASTSRVYHAVEDDIDINAGAVLEGKLLKEVAEELKTLLLGVLNGEPVKAEKNRQDGIICMYTQTSSF